MPAQNEAARVAQPCWLTGGASSSGAGSMYIATITRR